MFGLSTAYALALRPSFSQTQITVLDRSPFPSLDGASIDTSRIIRADYSDPAYASLAESAQREWRKQGPNDIGGEGRYTETGLVLVANQGHNGEKYVRNSLDNVKAIMDAKGDNKGVQELLSRAEIDAELNIGGGSGDWGYINRRSGWADAEAGVKFVRKQVEATGRVAFETATVKELVKDGRRVKGVRTIDNLTIEADLVILATGAWTTNLVDLSGRAQATGQVLCYLELTEEEQERLGDMPVLLNMTTGMFIITPSHRLLKVARHGYGYLNPREIRDPSGLESYISASLPKTHFDDPSLWVPKEGEDACRAALREMIPSLGDRPFTKSKICWYSDTPQGDFIITYHPEYDGLFVATGDSGHGYKFLPVIGERIVDCVEGNVPQEFKQKWIWPEKTSKQVVTEDGSRGGLPGMILEDELRRSCSSN